MITLEAQDSLTTRTTRGHLILLFFVILVQANDQPLEGQPFIMEHLQLIVFRLIVSNLQNILTKAAVVQLVPSATSLQLG